MLSFRTFLVGLFSSNSNTADLEAAKEAGRRDARELVGAYAEAFKEEVSSILQDAQDRVLYLEDSPKPAEDWSEWSRPELMAEARNQGITVSRDMTRADLITLLDGKV